METPEFFQTGYYNNAQFTPEKRHSDPKSAAAGDHFAVEDLLNFPNDDVSAADAFTGNSTDSSGVTAVDSCNSSFSGGERHFTGDMVGRSFADAQFSSDICVPYDELAELEWLSNFVEESFSSEDLQKLQIISGMKARPDKGSENRSVQPDEYRTNPTFNPEAPVPGKARSKRSRAAPGNWASRLSLLSPTTSTSAPPKQREGGEGVSSAAAASSGDGRRCLHCATDKTPQWRTGPMGPKTLCNACGVRFKSGRLVPEYRPAASPTFVLTKHSNSHRKVMELRRQKEVQRAHHHHHHQQQQQQFLHQNMVFDEFNGEDYLIHQHVGPDYRQLI